MAKVIDLGLLPPDDPVYFRGLRVKGKTFRNSNPNTPEQSKPASLDLARAVKTVSAEMNAAMERQPEAVEATEAVEED
jgi:hypothetical protein